MLTPLALYDHLQRLVSTHTRFSTKTPTQYDPPQFLIAYSGGLDSHVLLHLLAGVKALKKNQLRAIHVHHGLQNEADAWVKHCLETCAHLDVHCDIHYLNLDTGSNESIEAMAREARYQEFARAILPDEILLTAHHQDDQAETLLLQMFRGAGVQGLAAMPAMTVFEQGHHARPLLESTRAELETYAVSNGLKYIQDPSNMDLRFDRNYLRNRIMPSLKQRWPGLPKILSRVSDIQAETSELLDDLAAEDVRQIQVDDGRLAINQLLNYSVARQKLIVRYWIKQQGFLPPSSKKLGHLFHDVIHARQDAIPCIRWQSAEIRRFQGYLYIMRPLPEHDVKQVIPWDVSKVLTISHLGIRLQPGLLIDFLQELDSPVTVRFRQGGEKIYVPAKDKIISLKRLFQESGIPPWQRSRIPLVYCGGHLILVAWN